MDLPALHPGETWLIKSGDVYIKSAPFAVFLTTSRIIIRPVGTKVRPDHILPREAVAGAHAATSESGRPVLTVEARDGAGELRRIVLTFSGSSVTSRAAERDRWIQILSGNRDPLADTVREKNNLHTPKPKTENTVPYDNRKLSFHSGIHEHVVIRPREIRQEGRSGQEDSLCVRSRPPVDLEDRTHLIQEPGISGRESLPDANKPRGLPKIRIRNDPVGESPQVPETRLQSPDAAQVCVTCGKILPARSRFCSYCGEPVILRESGSGPVCERKTGERECGRQPLNRNGTIRSSGIKFIDPPARVQAEAGYDRYGISCEPERIRPGRRSRMPGTGPHASLRMFGRYRKNAVVAALVCAAVMIVAVCGLYQYLPAVSGGSTGAKAVAPVSFQKTAVAAPVTTVPVNSQSEISAGTTGLPTLTTMSVSSSDDSGSTINADPVSQDLNFILSCKCGIYIRVNYPGSWSGTYGVNEDTRSAQYSGEKIFQIENAQGTVSASFQKEDRSDQRLLVEIYNNGKIVGSGSSMEPKGSVAITADI